MNFKKHLLMLLGGATAATVAQATSAHADTVTVKQGDTTWQLAKGHNSSVEQIVKDNNLTNNGALIYVGQQLQINKDDGQNTEASQQLQANTEAPANTASQPTSFYNGTVTNQSNYYASSAQAGATNQGGSPNYASSVTGNEATAKAWIAARESGGNYGAMNGQYVGKYQLSASYLGGDYSPAHQEQVADSYVAGRYGSWSNAQAFWQSHGWY